MEWVLYGFYGLVRYALRLQQALLLRTSRTTSSTLRGDGLELHGAILPRDTVAIVPLVLAALLAERGTASGDRPVGLVTALDSRRLSRRPGLHLGHRGLVAVVEAHGLFPR